MNLEQQWELAGWGHLFIALGLPIFFFWGLGRTKIHSLLPRVFLTTTTVWLIRNVYRITVELPINGAYARSRGNEMYDGVGGNVAILILGWVEPFIICLVAASVVSIYRNRMKRKQPADDKVAANE